MSLPLRLWAPPHVGRAFPGATTFVINLRVKTTPSLCVVVDESGLLAIVADAADKNVVGVQRSSLSRQLGGLDLSHVPWLLLIRTKEGTALWQCLVESQETSSNKPVASLEPRLLSQIAERRPQRVDPGTARLIVESIRSYYSVQVLEPSVKGFLRILSLQFPRNDLYLFELLQNAVDDGAKNVSFRYLCDSKTLRVWHDGRRFNPLDVLGLASVGLSTKAKKKRTVGFMGVGFKACYKRYSEVTVSDGLFKFRFQKPPKSTGNDYAWVMQPEWVEGPCGIGGSNDGNEMECTAQCCCFDLRQCTAGNNAPLRDLAYLPLTVPPLLGRTALERGGVEPAGVHDENKEGSRWNLDWSGRKISVSRESLSAHIDSRAAVGLSFSHEGEVVVVSENGRDSRWMFLSDTFSPGEAARRTYEVHTKKTTAGVHMRESVHIFFRMSSQDGSPLPPRYSAGSGYSRSHGRISHDSAVSSDKARLRLKKSSSGAGTVGKTTNASAKANVGRGRIHAVLPTKLCTPFGFHLQGNWLLSVDRTDMQDSFENPWNRSLLERLPDLILRYLRWIPVASHSFSQRTTAYEMLPEFSLGSSSTSARLTNELTMKALGVELGCDAILRAVNTENLVPSLEEKKQEAGTTNGDSISIKRSFSSGPKTLFLPKPFLHTESSIGLGPSMLSQWLGGLIPADIEAMGTTVPSPLWAGVQTLSKNLLERSSSSLQGLYKSLSLEIKQQGQEAEESERAIVRAAPGLSLNDKMLAFSIKVCAAFGEAYLNMTNKSDAVAQKHGGKGSTGKTSLSSSNKRKHQVRAGINDTSAVKSSVTATSSIVHAATACQNRLTLPPPCDWHIFPTGTLFSVICPKHKLRIPDEDFCCMPSQLRNLLFPFVVDNTATESAELAYRKRMQAYQISRQNLSTRISRLERQKQEHVQKRERYHNHHRGRNYRKGKNNKYRDSHLEKQIQAARSQLGNVKEPIPPPKSPQCISMEWLPLCGGDDMPAVQVTPLQWRYARACVEAVTSEIPDCVVPVQKIITNFLTHISAKDNLSEKDVNSVIKVTHWCAQNGFGDAVSHVLTNVVGNHTEKTALEVTPPKLEKEIKLIPVQNAYLGGEFYSNNHAGVYLESIAKFLDWAQKDQKATSLRFVSSAYLDSTLEPPILTSSWLDFFKSVGVKTGIGFQAKCSRPTSADSSAMLPDKIVLRNSKKSVTLPYGLGNLDHKKAAVIDVDFDSTWIGIINAIGRNRDSGTDKGCTASSNLAIEAARTLSALIGQIVVRLDVETAKLNSKSIPAAKAAFNGTEQASNSTTSILANLSSQNLSKTSSSSCSSSIASSMALVKIPTRRRVFWLPPKQGGASAQDVGPAMWVKRLTQSKWVPVSSLQSSSTLKRPSATTLDATQITKSDKKHLKIAAVSANTIRALTVNSCGIALQHMLKFGTDPAPSPMVRLRKLVEAVKLMEKDRDGGSSLSVHYSQEEVEDIWSDVLRSASKNPDNTDVSIIPPLSQKERTEIALLAKSHKILPREKNYSASGTSSLGPKTFTCVTADRYLRMESAGSRPVDALKDSMCRCKFAVDIFRTGLGKYRDTLSELLSLSTKPTSKQAAAFLRYICSSEMDPGNGREYVILGWMLAVHAVLKGQSKGRGSSNFDVEKELKVCVHTPHMEDGMQTSPWKWVYLSKIDRFNSSTSLDSSSQEFAAKTRVFVNDSPSKINLLGTLLRREGFCSVFLLAQNSPYKSLENKVLDALKLPRLSNETHFCVKLLFDEIPDLDHSDGGQTSSKRRNKKRKTSNRSSSIQSLGPRMDDESARLRTVCAILRQIEPRITSAVLPLPRDISEGRFGDGSGSSSKHCRGTTLVRVDNLRRELHLNTSSVTGGCKIEIACWAAWFTSDYTDKTRHGNQYHSGTIFVQGENEDYVSDLSEEIAGRVCAHVPNFRPPGRVMNLLNHLDNQSRFTKFLKRDFGGESEEAEKDEEDNLHARNEVKKRKRVQEEDDEDKDTNKKRLRKDDNEAPHATWQPIKPGMGRGRSLTLPAWMTIDENKPKLESSVTPVDEEKPMLREEAQLTLNGNEGSPMENGGRGLLRSSEQGHLQDLSSAGRGRGRTIPAWASQKNSNNAFKDLVGQNNMDPKHSKEEDLGDGVDSIHDVDSSKGIGNVKDNTAAAAAAADALLGSLEVESAIAPTATKVGGLANSNGSSLSTLHTNISVAALRTPEAGKKLACNHTKSEESLNEVLASTNKTVHEGRGKADSAYLGKQSEVEEDGVPRSVKTAIAGLNSELNLGFSNLNLLLDALAKDGPLISFIGKAVAKMNLCSFMHSHFVTTSARTEGWSNIDLMRKYRDSLDCALDTVLGNLLPGGEAEFFRQISQGNNVASIDGKASRLLGAAFLDGGDELAVHIFEDVLGQNLLTAEEASLKPNLHM